MISRIRMTLSCIRTSFGKKSAVIQGSTRDDQDNQKNTDLLASEDKIQIITDLPASEDTLDFKNYSKELANIIRNTTPARFAVGVFGKWGTGKTSLMSMTKNLLDSDKKVVTVWFDPWRYEREEYLAVIPFLRTVKLTLDKVENSKMGDWEVVKNGVVNTAVAFLKSTKLTYRIKDVISAETDFGKIAAYLKGHGSWSGDGNSIYYHVTDFLENALQDLRKNDKDYRLVIFIDDLDRCSPEKALEVLESIKSFFDIEGIVFISTYQRTCNIT